MISTVMISIRPEWAVCQAAAWVAWVVAWVACPLVRASDVLGSNIHLSLFGVSLSPPFFLSIAYVCVGICYCCVLFQLLSATIAVVPFVFCCTNRIVYVSSSPYRVVMCRHGFCIDDGRRRRRYATGHGSCCNGQFFSVSSFC
jgi:hypothetical protein